MIYEHNNMRTSFTEAVFNMSKEDFKEAYKDKLSSKDIKEMLDKFPSEDKKGKVTTIGKELKKEGAEN